MDKRLKYKSLLCKNPRGEHRQENFKYPTQQYFHQYIPQGKVYKGKNKEMGLHQTKKASLWLKKASTKWKVNELGKQTYLPMIPQARI